MPQRRTSQRWEHPTYKYAYVREFRGMACSVIHGSAPLSTGYAWKPTSRVGAMQILDKRLQRYLHGGQAAPVNESNMTCGELAEQFAEVKFAKMGTYTRYGYIRDLKLLPPSMSVRETIQIRGAISRGLAKFNYAQNTQRKTYQRLRTVFAFGIEHGWLKVNPIHKDLLPSAVTVEATPFTQAEVNYAIATLKPQFSAFVLFLSSTGCRPIEAVRLHWSECHSDHVVLTSWKGGVVKKPRPRIIPYKLIPGAQLAIRMCEEHRIVEQPATTGNKLTNKRQTPPIDNSGNWATKYHPFGMNNYTKLSQAFNKQIETFGGQPRGLYDLRSYAINNWRAMGWPEPLRNLLAGHTPDIARSVYETPHTVESLVSML